MWMFDDEEHQREIRNEWRRTQRLVWIRWLIAIGLAILAVPLLCDSIPYWLRVWSK